MSAEQSAHIAKLQSITSRRLSSKYRAGALEHGNNVWDMSPEQLIECSIDEAIDQLVYLLTLRDRVAGKEAWMYDPEA